MQMVIVLGMHRSGTSVITHILSKAGFFVGEKSELMQGNQWNRKGYFERWSVLKANDLILSLCNGTWYAPPEEADIVRIGIDPKIESLLYHYRGYGRAAVKDPRMCLTFPVWRKALGKKVRIVHITREPEAIAASLLKRNGTKVSCYSGIPSWGRSLHSPPPSNRPRKPPVGRGCKPQNGWGR